MRILLAAALLIMPVAAVADMSPINVDHAWSRAAMAGHQGVIYLTISDTGAPDTLTSVATPVAEKADLHETINDQGVMKMRPVAALTVAPGKPLTLTPGGYHIMLMNLKQPLKEGDSFPVTLTFAKSGQVTTTVIVEKAGATMPCMNMGTMPMQGTGKQP